MTPDTTFPATTGVTDGAVANEGTLTDTKGGQSRGKNSENNRGPQRNHGKFSAEQILEIEAALRDKSLSIHDIAKMFNCTIATIGQINSGRILRYHKDDIKYPIRDGRKYRANRENKNNKSQN